MQMLPIDGTGDAGVVSTPTIVRLPVVRISDCPAIKAMGSQNLVPVLPVASRERMICADQGEGECTHCYEIDPRNGAVFDSSMPASTGQRLLPHGVIPTEIPANHVFDARSPWLSADGSAYCDGRLWVSLETYELRELRVLHQEQRRRFVRAQPLANSVTDRIVVAITEAAGATPADAPRRHLEAERLATGEIVQLPVDLSGRKLVEYATTGDGRCIVWQAADGSHPGTYHCTDVDSAATVEVVPEAGCHLVLPFAPRSPFLVFYRELPAVAGTKIEIAPSGAAPRRYDPGVRSLIGLVDPHTGKTMKRFCLPARCDLQTSDAPSTDRTGRYFLARLVLAYGESLDAIIDLADGRVVRAYLDDLPVRHQSDPDETIVIQAYLDVDASAGRAAMFARVVGLDAQESPLSIHVDALKVPTSGVGDVNEKPASPASR